MESEEEKARRDGRQSFLMAWGGVLLLGFGVLARVVTYARYRVLWLDESYTGVTIVDNGYAAFFGPLEHFQIVPPLYLSFAKSCAQVLGEHEYALRLPSLLAGVAGLWLFWLFAQRLTDRLGALFALAFFATSGMLIYYAAECKPYSSDVLIAVGLMLMAWRVQNETFSVRGVVLLALAGGVAVWCSFPSAFVLAGMGGAQFVAACETRDFRRFAAMLPAWFVWAGSFVLLYFLVVRAGLGATTTHHAQDLDSVMQESWKFGFLPFPPESLGELRLYKDQLARVFYTPGGFGSWVTGLAAFVAALGVWSLLRTNRFNAALVFLPAFAAFAASLLKLYPFDGRMILFLLPAMYLAVGEGTAFLLRNLPRTVAVPVWIVLLGLLLAPPAARAAAKAMRAEERHELDSAIAHIEQHWEPGDRLYLSYYDGLVYRIAGYWSDVPEEAVYREGVAYEYQADDAREIDAYVSGLDEGARVWLPLGFHIRAEDFLTRLNELAEVEAISGARPPLYLVQR